MRRVPTLPIGCCMDIGDHASPLHGQCYTEGRGVPKDNVTAAMWFYVAAEWGHEKAKEDLKAISLTMTSAEVLKAQQLGQEWLASRNQ